MARLYGGGGRQVRSSQPDFVSNGIQARVPPNGVRGKSANSGVVFLDSRLAIRGFRDRRVSSGVGSLFQFVTSETAFLHNLPSH